ncbi:uncharacterized protein METZ01_LOCUS306264, partial [marine metagenome]
MVNFYTAMTGYQQSLLLRQYDIPLLGVKGRGV